MKEIGIEDVEHVAMLARLELNDDEKRAMTAQLGEILRYVAKLDEIDTGAVEPTAHILPLRNALRDDALRPSLDLNAVLANAPKRTGDLFQVPRVVE
ncbi:MAG: Asp-tRNA(Asn)/Glu-tRNA(Gln) amidotransferase subunit GatC [Verrucomicrobia bacterium]|nr:Asp-tRNA(Asn)/Glu-tRNA(Gln) amidotransferase subunit GatC [Verrucomicrobiota bacterium]